MPVATGCSTERRTGARVRDSVAGTAQAVGFSPELSSSGGPWHAMSLQLWRGRSPVRLCECAPFRDVVVSYHTGGQELRGAVDGRWIRRASRPGQITITPPGTPITWDVSLGELQSCTLHIPPERFANLLGDESAEQVMDGIAFEFAADDAFLSGALSGLVQELQQPTARGPLYVDTLSDAVALHLIQRRGTAVESVVVGGLSRHASRIARETIESSVATGVSLDALARAVGMSRSHFTRAFRISLGCSPSEYLRARRIEMTKALLTSTRRSIAEVAVECGFASQAHMTDVFKSATDTTPLAFRRESFGKY